jgi:GrpB-like predicted nucleotidyltransferase (UPF0157 family)
MGSIEAPIEIVPYDASWPRRFEEERDALARAIRGWIVGAIEHVGSTAVPGLAAKPVIDIMAGVKDLDSSRPAIPALEAIGYCYAPYRPDDEHWFCKPSPAYRTHHLHLIPYGGPSWLRTLAFRDHLRAHPEAAAEYAELKRKLARQYRLDREKYTDEKGPFIARIVDLALRRERRPRSS